MGSNKIPARKTSLKKARARKVTPRFKTQDLERRMVEQRWVVNGHVMTDYFPVYMPVGAEA